MKINFNIFDFLLFKQTLWTEVFKIVFLLNALFGGENRFGGFGFTLIHPAH